MTGEGAASACEAKIEPVEKEIKTYRGFSILQKAVAHFEVWRDGFKVTACGSAWGCIVYIDERLQP